MEDYVAIDVETANASRASICAIGIAQFKRGELTNSFYSLINPHEPFADRNTAIHGIDANLVATAPTFSDLLPLLHRWLDHQLVVSHTNFDISALRQTLAKHGQPQLPFKYFDSYIVCQQLIVYPHHRLADMAAYFGANLRPHYRVPGCATRSPHAQQSPQRGRLSSAGSLLTTRTEKISKDQRTRPDGYLARCENGDF